MHLSDDTPVQTPTQDATRQAEFTKFMRTYQNMVFSTAARLSGNDAQAEDIALLREQVTRGITICIIEHNLDIVQGISDRIAFLDQGRLLAEGDPKTILSDPALAAIYFGERAA